MARRRAEIAEQKRQERVFPFQERHSTIARTVVTRTGRGGGAEDYPLSADREGIAAASLVYTCLARLT
jgi:hypothetical protein